MPTRKTVPFALLHLGVGAVFIAACSSEAPGSSPSGTPDAATDDATADVVFDGFGATDSSYQPSAAFLGRACESDADCGDLHCIRSTDDIGETGSGGPAHGYCSLDCSRVSRGDAVFDDPCGPIGGECFVFGPAGTAATSKAWCMARCMKGPGTKCGGRDDVMCAEAGRSLTPTCAPMCATNADCGSRACDFRTGFCIDGQPGVAHYDAGLETSMPDDAGTIDAAPEADAPDAVD